jgi:hypothetical protein
MPRISNQLLDYGKNRVNKTNNTLVCVLKPKASRHAFDHSFAFTVRYKVLRAHDVSIERHDQHWQSLMLFMDSMGTMATSYHSTRSFPSASLLQTPGHHTKSRNPISSPWTFTDLWVFAAWREQYELSTSRLLASGGGSFCKGSGIYKPLRMLKS